jgi:hypothetical protein
MKALLAVGAVAVVVPAISEAHTHYTGKTPAQISAIADNGIIPPSYMTASTSVKKSTKLTSTTGKKHTLKSKHKTLTSSKLHKHHPLTKLTSTKKKTI